MKKVLVLRIEDYDCDFLVEKIGKALSGHFPLEKYFTLEDTILLKPNLLMEASPEEAITTHPVFIEALGRIFQKQGFPVAIADSSGGFADMKDMDYIYDSCGVKKIARDCGFELLLSPQSVMKDNMPLCSWSLPEYKGRKLQMVNLPKLKTHDLATMTLAVKNLYGCISGLHKSHLHKVYPSAEELMDILIWLYRNIKPKLNIVDGILAMEGAGPAKKGTPRKLNLVVIGDDALYVDYVIGKLVGLNEKANPLITAAKAKGLIDDKELELIYDSQEYPVKDFKFPGPFILSRIPRPLFALVKMLIKFWPRVDKDKCTGCAVCQKVCPQKAITIIKNKAFIDRSKCIMCMCCGEMCRFGAVYLDRSCFLKIIDKLVKGG